MSINTSWSLPKFVENYFGLPDHRIKDWFLVNSPKWFITTLSLYFGFVFFGTKFMSTRKAFVLKKPLILFNAFQIYISFYIFKEVLLSALSMNYSVICQPITYQSVSMRMVSAFWYVYLSKFVDLFDTVFLVLKKKTNQLSFLHIYHHSSMLVNWYLGVLYCPGGHAYFSVLANSFVHMIMYSYYLLAALGPKMQKYLWWKKYLTQIQLAQFFIIIAHIISGLIANCNHPKWLSVFSLFYVLTLICLFINFYYKSYAHKIRGRKERLIFTLPSVEMHLKNKNKTM